MKLPSLEIYLPEWRENDFILLREAEQKVAVIARTAGQGSDAFEKAYNKIKKNSLDIRRIAIHKYIENTTDVRAFTSLLSTDEQFVEHIKITKNILISLVAPRSPMSTLSLTQLIRAFFVYFDAAAPQEIFDEWCEFIKKQLAQQNKNNRVSDISVYAENASILFSSAGPSNIVSIAQKESVDLDNVLTRFSLTGFLNSRFVTICRYQYYLETLKTIPLGAEHEVLQEVIKKDVFSAPFEETKQLGHAILEVLIDRSEGNEISQAWQNTILTIAGDPRVPKSNTNYQRWWSVLGEKRIALMRGWLSRFDLSLFLGVLEQNARDGGDQEMERMFTPRKVFMNGLLEQGVVVESRLFLTKTAEYYLKRNYKQSELPSYATVTGGHASVIYLRLKNNIHLIEGTHSFSIRVMDQLPEKIQLDNYNRNSYNSRDLGVGLGIAYIREFGSTMNLLEATHQPGLLWQNKVIKHLQRLNVNLDVATLISPESYRYYKSKFGVGWDEY